MSDLFHEKVPFSFVDSVFDVMRRAEHHTFQVLTKRPDRLVAWQQQSGIAFASHIWLGVSVESRAYLWRVDRLRTVQAAIRFISAEPLLGPLTGLDLTGISWVITGGESGGSATRSLVTRTSVGWQPKPEALTWVRDLRDLCRKCDVAFFHKQWGGPTPKIAGRHLDRRIWNEYPEVTAEAH